MAKPDNTLDLIVVVSGVPHAASMNVHQPLHTLVREVLRDTGNTGRALEDYELRTEAGDLLALDAKPTEVGLRDGVTLFLTPKAGAGG